MKELTSRQIAEYRKAFGAERVESLDVRSGQGPLGMLALLEEVRLRPRSRGGRPTMPEWDIKRPIPLRRTDWEKLVAIGKELGLSPAQCAALLIEHGLRALEKRAA